MKLNLPSQQDVRAGTSRILVGRHNEYHNFVSQKKGHDNNKPKKVVRLLLHRYYDFVAIVLGDGEDLIVEIDVRLIEIIFTFFDFGVVSVEGICCVSCFVEKRKTIFQPNIYMYGQF